MKYQPKKQSGKTWRIAEEAANYIETECDRRTRGYTDQLSHMTKLYRSVVEEVGGGYDDIEMIMARIREWKKKAEEKK